jgi:hypothetical protein
MEIGERMLNTLHRKGIKYDFVIQEAIINYHPVAPRRFRKKKGRAGVL